MTRKDVKGDQPSGGETTWTNTGATRYGRGQHKTGSFGDDMLRPSPNHGTQRLPNDDDDDVTIYIHPVYIYIYIYMLYCTLGPFEALRSWNIGNNNNKLRSRRAGSHSV